jgi:hypothetical protein
MNFERFEVIDSVDRYQSAEDQRLRRYLGDTFQYEGKCRSLICVSIS